MLPRSARPRNPLPAAQWSRPNAEFSFALRIQQYRRVLLRDIQQTQRRAPRPARSLLPCLHRLRAHTQEARKYRLARIEPLPNLPDLIRLHRFRPRRHFGYAQIDTPPAFKCQRITQRFPHFIINFHFNLLRHAFLLHSPQFRDQLPQSLSFLLAQIFLLVLIE